MNAGFQALRRLSGPRAVVVLVAAPGLLALLVEPLRWLVTTWTDPAWDSSGAWVAAACLALAVRSVLSGRASGPAGGPAGPRPRAVRVALLLVGATALVRLAGRVLAINVIGALALVFDVAALGLALGLDRRRWAVHPAALAALFAFSLPVEQILQRLFGYPLRLVSAAVAHGLLAPFAEGLQLHGTLLVRDGMSLAVDLPCSGAQGLMLLGALATAVACRRRLGPGRAVAAGTAIGAGALLSNTVRIVVLFVGVGSGLPVMAEPWHSLVGLIALALGAIPLLSLAARWPDRTGLAPPDAPKRSQATRRPGPRRALACATIFSLAGLAIAAAPAHPVDVSSAVRGAALPAHLGPWLGSGAELSEIEKTYFERFGGRADKRTYRREDGIAHTAVLVRTGAPLRHMHGPDRCLIGAGHTVERLGVRPGPIPSVLWRSTGPDGRAWRVEASFVGQHGQTASTISEVVWRWIGSPGSAWTQLERITSWQACQDEPARCAEFDAALFAALDIVSSPNHEKREDQP